MILNFFFLQNINRNNSPIKNNAFSKNVTLQKSIESSLNDRQSYSGNIMQENINTENIIKENIIREIIIKKNIIAENIIKENIIAENIVPENENRILNSEKNDYVNFNSNPNLSAKFKSDTNTNFKPYTKNKTPATGAYGKAQKTGNSATAADGKAQKTVNSATVAGVKAGKNGNPVALRSSDFEDAKDRPFEFALGVEHANRCERLFANPPFDEFNMSQIYHQKLPIFNRHYNQQLVNGTYDEGYSALIEEKIKILHYLAQASFVRTICETGFNYGHSSFNFLTANPKAIVHSFDLGVHPYAKVMAVRLGEMFPGRIAVHFGDSSATVPEFFRQNPALRCDLMFVDGGHTYKVAKADLDNFAKVANKVNNVIILDDYPTNWGVEFGVAWEELVAGRIISEKFRCMKFVDFQRGILAGVVL